MRAGYMKTADVAAKFGVVPTTVHDWIKNGLLPGTTYVPVPEIGPRMGYYEIPANVVDTFVPPAEMPRGKAGRPPGIKEVRPRRPRAYITIKREEDAQSRVAQTVERINNGIARARLVKQGAVEGFSQVVNRSPGTGPVASLELPVPEIKRNVPLPLPDCRPKNRPVRVRQYERYPFIEMNPGDMLEFPIPENSEYKYVALKAYALAKDFNKAMEVSWKWATRTSNDRKSVGLWRTA